MHRLRPGAIRKCDCGRIMGPNLGCAYCPTLRCYWWKCRDDHPEMSREHCILVGSMVAGMNDAYVREHGLGRMVTKEQFEAAIDLASAYMKSFGYFFRDNKGTKE